MALLLQTHVKWPTRSATVSRGCPVVAPQCTVRTVQVPLSGAYSSFIPQKFATRLGVVRQVTYASQPDLTTKLDHGTTTPEVHLNSKNSTGTASSGAAHQESAHLHEGLPAYVITKGTQPLWPSDTDKPFETACSLLQPLSLEVTNWFAQRKITAETLQYNQVQECALQDRQGTIIPAVAVVFKYLHGISQVKLRTLDKQYKHYFAVKGESTLYGLAQLELSPTLIIVEGEIDKFSLEEAGYKNVVSVPGGAPECVRDRELPLQSADKAFKYLWHSQDYLQQLSCILLASDKDPPGHALAEELARRLGRDRCLRVLWQPPDPQVHSEGACKDANDVLVQYGASAVQQCINNAKYFPLEGPYKYYPDKRKQRKRQRTTNKQLASP